MKMYTFIIKFLNKDKLHLHDSYFNAFIVCDNIYVVEDGTESLKNTLK